MEEVVRKEPAVAKHVAHGIEGTRSKPQYLKEIVAGDEQRIDMHDEELNRVLGGGLVEGSLTLIGGEPGIGKSTLVLQTVLRLADKKVLYISGEESSRQLKMRADRIPPLRKQQPAHRLRNVAGTDLHAYPERCA